MKKQISIRTKVYIGLGMFFFIAVISVVTVSYLVIRKLTFTGKYDERRIRRNMRAQKIRQQLIETHNAQSVSFLSKDKILLRGLFIERDMPLGTLVLCHGYRNYKESMYRFVMLFPRYNLLFFDFRAHGESEGNITTIGAKENRDVIAAAKWVKNKHKENNQYKKLPIIIVGVSMGGASALKAASKKKDCCDALIIDSSYADLWETVKDVFGEHSGLPHYPFLPVVEILFYIVSGQNIRKMRPIDYITQITKPILLIHSCYDDHTRPDNTLRLYQMADPKIVDLWIGPKCNHALLHRVYPEDYYFVVKNFLRDKKVVVEHK